MIMILKWLAPSNAEPWRIGDTSSAYKYRTCISSYLAKFKNVMCTDYLIYPIKIPVLNQFIFKSKPLFSTRVIRMALPTRSKSILNRPSPTPWQNANSFCNIESDKYVAIWEVQYLSNPIKYISHTSFWSTTLRRWPHHCSRLKTGGSIPSKGSKIRFQFLGVDEKCILNKTAPVD